MSNYSRGQRRQKGENRKKSQKVWLEDISAIVECPSVIPNKRMTRNEKINTITRLVLLIFAFMLLVNYRYSLNFIVLALLIILILYFINTKEYYKTMDEPTRYRNPLIGQNSQSIKKMAIEPIITPRAHDREVWSYPSYRHSAINYNQARYDISEEYTPVEQKEDYKDYDLRLSSYTNFDLDKFNTVCNQRPPLPQPIQPVQSNIQPIESTPIDMVTNEPSIEGFYRRPRVEKFNTSTPIDRVTKPLSTDNNFQTIPDTDSDVPNQDLLIPRTITSIYGPGAVTNEEKIKYLTNIQPNEYSYSDVTYPINSNLGISYTPEIPPRVLDQVATPYGTYPLFHRIDPQLVRDQNIPPERLEELPRRTAWSAKYSGFDAAPGTVNFEDIYDPRFNGYGDEYRSYGDVNLGQVQYYYGDVDAYRYPNFGIRSKVDYIDYIDPMGRVLPEYDRQVGLNDIKKTVHDQYTSDSLYFREGLQERLMRKRNRELWQLRSRPIRKDAHAGTFTSHY